MADGHWFTHDAGLQAPFFLMAGPCVIESETLAMDVAEFLVRTCGRLGIPYIFKASFDKANRSSHHSFRGLGFVAGLRILQKIKETFSVPVMTDVHSVDQISDVAAVVDVLQTPAFLCRQTDFICAVAQAGRAVNFKKGQFLSPHEMVHVIKKARHAAGNDDIPFFVCERGFSFGYHNLVVDMRSLAILRQTMCPVVCDVTHSLQLPGAGGERSLGNRCFIPVLARAAVAAGIAGVFMETHPDPAQALSDGPNSWPLPLMPELLEQLQQIDHVVKNVRWLENWVGDESNC